MQSRPGDGEEATVPKGRSKLIHHLLSEKEIVFISLDIEHSGDEAGIVQLLAEMTCLELIRNNHTKGKSKGKVNTRGDTATNICRDEECFDKYV